tara:strand:- start:172 stop:513 length:342 start_codon:yes stop_codon:yes gene_type:complete
MSLSMGRSRNSRPTFLDPDVFKHSGSVLSEENSNVLQNILLGKISKMDSEEAVIASTALMQGVQSQAQEVSVTAYECETAQKKTVTVTSVPAMEAIINSGGKFLGETRQSVKL